MVMVMVVMVKIQNFLCFRYVIEYVTDSEDDDDSD